MRNGLTFSMIFEAQSANFGEGMGNIATLKKLSRAGGDGYTYISRQALRYSIVEQLGWDKTPVEAMGSGAKTVVQFTPLSSITDYPEIDLFGYMKTDKGKGATTRSAVVRLSSAVSLEPYSSDLDFLTNMGLVKRAGKDNSIAQTELHMSFYAYTVTVDLDRVGVDGNVVINSAEKAKRVNDLLSALEFLYRDIKGRRENLSPVLVIGGLYERKCPYFENRLKLNGKSIDIEMLLQSAETIKEDTLIGYVSGTFKNDAAIKEQLAPISIPSVFSKLRAKVEERYHEGN
jgi:CRISPR-associated protein Cst2